MVNVNLYEMYTNDTYHIILTNTIEMECPPQRGTYIQDHSWSFDAFDFSTDSYYVEKVIYDVELDEYIIRDKVELLELTNEELMYYVNRMLEESRIGWTIVIS